MNVLVSSSQHFVLTEDGDLWAPNASESYNFWSRYLEVYDEVNLCARTALCRRPPDGWILATGPGVKPLPLPDFYGPSGLAANYLKIRHLVRAFLAQVEAVQLRIPCPIGNEIWRMLPARRPYGGEVVSDPYDVLAPGSISHPLRPLFRWYLARLLRRQCRQASAVAYVTQRTLQTRYPPGSTTFAASCSDVELPSSAYVTSPRPAAPTDGALRLIMVGNFRQLYKAPHLLIEAVKLCVDEYDLNLNLVFVGDGHYRTQLEEQAAACGLAHRIHFTGQLAERVEIIAQLDQADLFVLPSLSEGLPRALVEAMARGLPCIGSTAGGIPELLPPEDLVPPGDVAALAGKIRAVALDPAQRACMAARNLAKARQYHESALKERWVAVYRHVREQTRAWLNSM